MIQFHSYTLLIFKLVKSFMIPATGYFECSDRSDKTSLLAKVLCTPLFYKLRHWVLGCGGELPGSNVGETVVRIIVIFMFMFCHARWNYTKTCTSWLQSFRSLCFTMPLDYYCLNLTVDYLAFAKLIVLSWEAPTTSVMTGID